MAAMAAASYGTNPLFAVNLYQEGMNANSVLLFRYMLGLPILAAILLSRGRSLRISRKELGPIAVLGILMAVSSLTLFESYNYINSGIASTLLFVYPILVTLLMVVFFHEKFKILTGICLGIMLGGLYLLMRTPSGETLDTIGVLLVMVSSLTYALYLVLTNVSKHIRIIPTTKLLFYVLLFGSMVFIVMIPFGNELTLPHTAGMWGNLLALAVIPTIISLFCTTIAIQHIGSTTTAIFGALEPVTAVILSVFALGQGITGREIAGAGLIVVATTLVVLGDGTDRYLLRMRTLFRRQKK